MIVGSLFSGIGGFDWGLERAGMKVKWQVEIDFFARAILEKHYPKVDRWNDIRTFLSGLPETGASISSAADSHATICPEQDGVQESPDQRAVCGRNLPGSFAWYDRDTSSWRTWQRCLDGGLAEFSGTWPRSGMMRNGIVYRLRQSVPHISGIGSSSWPTDKTPYGLPYYPTVTADDVGHRKKRYSQGGSALSLVLNGPVNPLWAEWFMGFPNHWTDYGDLAYERLAKASYRKSRGGSAID